MYLDIHIKVTK